MELLPYFDTEFIEFDVDNNDFVDFQDIEHTSSIQHIQTKPIIKQKHDTITIEKYKVLRKTKMDPITYMELDEKYAFAFPYKWDPYTGERIGIDENGPLYFDPDILIKHFYTKRLDKLWIMPSDETSGYYTGYYDDAVGLGNTFKLNGRGAHPEWYLFRIPIIDCYLMENHNKQLITFGPMLTNEEIEEIEQLANLRKNNYIQLFGKPRPSLVKMKNLYDNAISKTPLITSDISTALNTLNKLNNITSEQLQEIYSKENRRCVDKLVKMYG